MKIVIPGGSGQVGTMLARAMHAQGHEVVVLSRRPQTTDWRTLEWDAKSLGTWITELEGADVVINMTGRSVNCRYHAKHRQEIMASRIDSTRAIGEGIANARQPPSLWLQASTATIYAHRFDAPNDEISGIIGGNETHAPDTWRFSIQVAKEWEAAAQAFILPATRLVLLRSAMTMSPDPGGVFDVLMGPVRLRLGGQNGDGQQYVSWIHEVDFLRAIDWLITHPEISGPVNLASPNPLTNHEFMRGLRTAYGTRFGLPATRWMLELGAIFLRTETELILKSRRVVPRRLLDSGFQFQFPEWNVAAQELCRRWRQRKL